MKIGALMLPRLYRRNPSVIMNKQGLIPPQNALSGNFRHNEEHLQRLSFICNRRNLDISLSEIKPIEFRKCLQTTSRRITVC